MLPVKALLIDTHFMETMLYCVNVRMEIFLRVNMLKLLRTTLSFSALLALLLVIKLAIILCYRLLAVSKQGDMSDKYVS